MVAQGIMVNALCPGWVDTDMARNSIQSMADAQGMSFEECKAQQEAILPSLRMTTPAEMAQWVDFVFSGLGEGEDVAEVGDVHRTSLGRQQWLLDGLSSGCRSTFEPCDTT